MACLVWQVHYIRCVKPNAESVPHAFTVDLVAEQLRCAGMLEAVRISRAAYPHRLVREGVLKRFAPLGREEGGKAVGDALKAGGEKALKALLEALLAPEGYCIGKTKVFFKGSELPNLEARRTVLCSKRAVRIQSHARRKKASRYFYAVKKATPVVQAAARMRAAPQPAIRAARRVHASPTRRYDHPPPI